MCTDLTTLATFCPMFHSTKLIAATNLKPKMVISTLQSVTNSYYWTVIAGNKEIQLIFDHCHHPNSSSMVTYPVNVMVAKYLIPNTDFSSLLGHQLLLQEDTSTAPQFQIDENAYTTGLAATQSNQLQLQTVMQNIKKYNIHSKCT